MQKVLWGWVCNVKVVRWHIATTTAVMVWNISKHRCAHLAVIHPYMHVNDQYSDSPPSGFPQTSLEKFQWFFNDISRQKSQISMIILNVTKRKNTGTHVTYGLLIHLMTTIGCFKKIYKVFLLDLNNNISVNNVYVKYIYIYPCSWSKLCLFQNSMIFPWTTDLKSNNFSITFSFLQISSTFQEIQWFFHDLETDLNFNDFSRAMGTLTTQFL